MSNLPPGALHDPRAPFNQPDTFCPSCHPEAVLDERFRRDELADLESNDMDDNAQIEAVCASHDAEFEVWKQDNLRLCRDHS